MHSHNIALILLCGSLAPALVHAQEWTFSAGPIFLRRDNPNHTPVFVDNDDGECEGICGVPSESPPIAHFEDEGHPTVLCYASDFNFDYEVGLDVGIRRSLTDIVSVDARYFGVHDWDASKHVMSFDGLQFATNPPSGQNGPAFQQEGFVVYGSSLHSTEVNLVYSYYQWLRFLIGFRWIELGEMINGQTTNGDGDDYGPTPETRLEPTPGVNTFYNSVNNHLYGAQIGTEVIIWTSESGFTTIDGFAKAGIFANSADHSAAYVGGRAGANTWWNHASADSTSFLGELGITCSLELLDWLIVRFGYEALWISDVALASNQIPITPTTLHHGAITTNDSVFYHGGLLQFIVSPF